MYKHFFKCFLDFWIFKVIKFKTMTDERDVEGNLLPDAQHLTKVDKNVRFLSIDELPQLIDKCLEGRYGFDSSSSFNAEIIDIIYS